MLPRAVEALAEMMVAIERIEQFLNFSSVQPLCALLSAEGTTTSALATVGVPAEMPSTLLSIKDAVFSWGTEQGFQLSVPDLVALPGEVVALVGAVGSGESLLIGVDVMHVAGQARLPC